MATDLELLITFTDYWRWDYASKEELQKKFPNQPSKNYKNLLEKTHLRENNANTM